MKVALPSRTAGTKGALLALEVEVATKARRIRVETSDPLEALDLAGEAPGGVYDVPPGIPRVHVPLRVTRAGAAEAMVRVTVEDAAGVIPPETWEGMVALDAPAAPSHARRIALLALVFAALAGGLAWFVLRPALEKPSVPILLGKRQADAERLARARGFAPVVETVDARDDKEVGVVIGQAPAAGSRPPRGSTLALTVGRPSGSSGVLVPQLAGRALPDAEATLTDLGLTATSVFEDAMDVLEAKVLRQHPEAGTRAPRGTAVEVVVGRRKPVPTTSVPDVVGLAAADAQAAITTLHLVPKATDEAASEDQDGKVVRQTPAADERAAEGSTVEIVVGRRPAPPPVATIPDVVGAAREDAERRLTEAGFVPVVEVADVPSVAPGTVASQDPRSGAARRGAQVALRVAAPRAPAPQPAPPTPAAPAPEPKPAEPAPVAPAPPATAPPATAPPPTPAPPAAPENGTPPAPPGPAPAAPPERPPAPAPPAAPPAVPPSPAPAPPAPPSNPPPTAEGTAPSAPTSRPAPAPDVVGMEQRRAEVAVRRAGLGWRTRFEDVEADTPEGVVLRQSPLAGEVSPDGTVDLVVARRAAPGTTPSGSTATTPSAPAGTEGAPAEPARPPAGGTAPRASPPPPSGEEAGRPAPTAAPSVPTLEGKDPVEAVEIALRSGLRPKVVAVDAAGSPLGRVRRQDPAPGTALKAGAPVTLELATPPGAATIEVPDVVGQGLGEAVLHVAQVGLGVQIVRMKAAGAPSDAADTAGGAEVADRVVGQSAVGRFPKEYANPLRLFVLEP